MEGDCLGENLAVGVDAGIAGFDFRKENVFGLEFLELERCPSPKRGESFLWEIIALEIALPWFISCSTLLGDLGGERRGMAIALRRLDADPESERLLSKEQELETLSPLLFVPLLSFPVRILGLRWMIIMLGRAEAEALGSAEDGSAREEVETLVEGVEAGVGGGGDLGKLGAFRCRRLPKRMRVPADGYNPRGEELVLSPELLLLALELE